MKSPQDTLDEIHRVYSQWDSTLIGDVDLAVAIGEILDQSGYTIGDGERTRELQRIE